MGFKCLTILYLIYISGSVVSVTVYHQAFNEILETGYIKFFVPVSSSNLRSSINQLSINQSIKHSPWPAYNNK